MRKSTNSFPPLQYSQQNKMRHLLDNLQKDLETPPMASITSLGAGESDDPLKRLQSHDVDHLLRDVFERGQTEDVTPAAASTPVNQSLDVEFNPLLLNEDEHLRCAVGDEDGRGGLEQVDELGNIMAESLSVSETLKDQQEVCEQEQTRGDVSDDEF